MIKKHRNIEHLDQLIIGSIQNDRLTELQHYISVYPNNLLTQRKISGRFINLSIINNSITCYNFLMGIGFKVSPNFILSKAPISKIGDIYILMCNLGIKIDISKSDLIRRLLEPHKIMDNVSRIDIAMEYLKSGFFEHREFKNALDKIQLDNTNSRFNGVIGEYIREYKLHMILSEK